MISKCEHKFKKRVYGPFSTEQLQYKVICADCLGLIESVKGDAGKKPYNAAPVAVDDTNRLELTDLIDQLMPLDLGEWERKFTEDFLERTLKYDNVRVSEKQQAILDRMQGKYLPNATPTVSVEKKLSDVSANATDTKDSFKPGDDSLEIPF